MDMVDAPLSMVRPRQRTRDPLQNELQSRLAERRRQNLTHGMTSSDSEEEGDTLGDLGRGRRTRNSFQKQDSMDLGATMRYQDRDSLLNSLLDEKPKRGESKFLKKQTSTTEPPFDGRKTPTGLTADDILNDRKPAMRDDRKSPFLSRKSPLLEDINERRPAEWQPPSYHKKAPSPDFLRENSGSSLRKSPTSTLEPLVDTSSSLESARRRHQMDKSPRLEPLESPRTKPSPRPRKTDSLEDKKKKRSTPTMDLFGSNRITLDEESEEEKSAASPQPKRRQSKDLDRSKPFPQVRRQSTDKHGSLVDRRSPSESKRTSFLDRQSSVDGRKTPVESRKTPVDGRKTPVDGKKTPIDGRKTPTRSILRKTPTLEKESPESEYMERKQAERSRTPSLMELMAGDDFSKDSMKEKRSYKKTDTSMSRERSHDSITDEMENYGTRSQSRERMKYGGRHSPFGSRRTTEQDNSSVCEELDIDPENKTSNNKEKVPERKPRKSNKKQTEEHRICEEAIDNVADAQNKMQYIEPDKTTTKTKSEKVDQHKPKPRYTVPGQKTETIVYDVNDTKSMRQAIFDEWYQEKMKRSKQELSEKKRKEKEEEEKKAKEKEDKIMEAKASFNAWSDRKKEVLKNQVKTKRLEEKKKRDEETEKEEKKIYAAKSFEKWKENKEHVIKSKISKKQREEERKKRDEEEEKERRIKSANSAFRTWKDRKEIVIRKQVKEEKKNKPDLYEEEKIKAQKEENARREYEKWLEEKEKRERKEKEKKRHQYLSDDMDFRPAWSPANKTIPFGR